MDLPRWARQDILDLVDGCFVWFVRADFSAMPAPAWIAGASLGEPVHGTADAQASTHPDDRLGLAATVRAAVEEPGRPQRYTYRTNVLGAWTRVTVTLVDLTHQPEVGGILAAVPPGQPVPDPGVDELANEGEHDNRSWLFGRLDPLGRIVEIDGKVAELTGRAAGDVVGLTPLELLHPDCCQDSVALWVDLLGRAGATATSRRCFLHPDGTEVWAELSYVNRLAGDGTGDIVWLAVDITDRRAQEQALAESHDAIRDLAEDFRLLADEVPAAVFRCDADGLITFHNARWADLPTEGCERLHDVIHAEDHEQLDKTFAELLAAGTSSRARLELRSADDQRVLAVTCRSDGLGASGRAPGSGRISRTPGSGRVGSQRIVGSVEDVTSTVRLRREARHDDLTGLVNRKGLEERLWEALRDDPAGTLLVFFDLDGFKSINDVHGHEAGDMVLAELGSRLARAVRPADTVSRYGGDEFVLVCTAVVDDGVDDGTTAVVERLQLVLAAPILFAGGVWQPSASIGVARAEPGDDPSSLLRRADLSMLAAKRDRKRSRR
jgi:diguanylate cyclase (GGDEF)-like protein/PAS domain S-box-containing protein